MRSRLMLAFICGFFLSAALFAESAAGVHWTAPSGWKTEGPMPMRAATYTLAPAAGDAAGGECGVYFFGAGQGGSVDANIDRWKSQFTVAGKPAPAVVRTRAIHGLMATVIDASGDYSGMGGPIAASPKVAPGYRLLGAIVAAPGGNLFIKLTGPQKTIAANQQKFEQLLTSIQADK